MSGQRFYHNCHKYCSQLLLPCYTKVKGWLEIGRNMYFYIINIIYLCLDRYRFIFFCTINNTTGWHPLTFIVRLFIWCLNARLKAKISCNGCRFIRSENASPLLYTYPYAKTSLKFCLFWITRDLQERIPRTICDHAVTHFIRWNNKTHTRHRTQNNLSQFCLLFPHTQCFTDLRTL